MQKWLYIEYSTCIHNNIIYSEDRWWHQRMHSYSWVQLYLIQSLVLLTDINKVFVHIITAHPVTVNFCTSYNKTTIHCSLMRQFPTIIIHFLRSQKLPISVTNNYIECLISQSAISPCKLFLNLSHSIHSFIHSFIPLACAKCDDSLPFSGASSIPLCYIPFSSTLFHPLIFHAPSLHLAIYFLVYRIYNTFLGNLFSSLLCTCPNKRNLLNLNVSLIVGFLTIAWVSLLVNILQFYFSLSYSGPKFLLYTFLSKMFICFLSLFVSIQVFDAWVQVLSIIVIFSLNFSFF